MGVSMGSFLSALITVSIGGFIAITLIALWAHFSRIRYAAKWRCVLWAVLCFRLLLPFSPITAKNPSLIQIELPQNVVSDAPVSDHDPISNHIEGNFNVQPSIMPPPQSDHSEPSLDSTRPSPVTTPTSKQYPQISLFSGICAIWFLGVICMLGKAWLAHIRFLKYIQRWQKTICEPEILNMYHTLCSQLKLSHPPKLRICIGLKAPMLAGIFHPVLLLPEHLPSSETLQYVLLHELVHCKRKDIWLKALALLINSLHWFNPMMWHMTRLVERDTEHACDETVLTYLSPAEYKVYAKTILDTVAQLQTPEKL